MYVVEAILVTWLVVGTLALKRLLNLVKYGRATRGTYLALALILAVSPPAVLRCFSELRSSSSVLVAGVSFFWFCILAARANPADVPSACEAPRLR